MDGNGRWAKAKGLSRTAGHKEGAKAVQKVVEAAVENGVRYLTLYAFSVENWKRPKTEVSTLMSLLKRYLEDQQETLLKEKIRLRVIGMKEKFSKEIVHKIKDLEEATKNFDRMDLAIALNYGGRQEILGAAKKAMAEAKKGFLNPEDLTENMFEKFLDTQDMPPVDLLIRTSGEERVSNFLLWQIAYAEMLFIKKNWPDFSKRDFKAAIKEFNERERRFGGLKVKRIKSKGKGA